MQIGQLAQQAGVAVDTVRYYEKQGLPAAPPRRGADMGGLREAAQTRLAELDARIAELQRVRDGLRQVVEACPGHGALDSCPILSALSQEAH